MASLLSPKDIRMDSASLREYASGISRAAQAVFDAERDARNARRFERWKFPEKDTISNELSAVFTMANRIARNLEALSRILNQSASDFDLTESNTIARLGDAELKL